MVKSFGVTGRQRIKMIDPVILICVLILTVMSILTLYGGLGEFDDFSTTKFIVQVVSSILGLIMMVIIAVIDYEDFVEKCYVIFFIGSVALLGITLVFGTSEGENLSYLRFGPIGIQPSEFVKAAYIVTFSKHIYYVKENINNPKKLLGLMLHAGIILGLILISGDLGVALVYLGLTAVMLFCAGLSIWYFAISAGVVALAFPYLWPLLKWYQQQRIIVGFNPELDPIRFGYQALLGRQAIANGGVWGKGLHGGTYYTNLPAAHTDFIFSTFCEKFGFVGGVILILTLIVLVVRILMIARKARKDYGAYICVGAAAIIIIQTLENAGMCMAFLPVVGITLPFMSYGGSSMLALYMIIGLVQSVRSHQEKYFFNPDVEDE